MIINVQTSQYRCRTMRPGLRQRVSARPAKRMSMEMRQAVSLTLGIALFLVLAGGQFFHWIAQNDYRQVVQLQAVSASLDSANINLRARKAGLMSPKHIEAVAAVRLDLHAPTSGQVHRL